MIVSPPTVSEITCGLFTRYLNTRPPSVFEPLQPSPEHISQELMLNLVLISQDQTLARMRRFARISGIALAVLGGLTLVWVIVVWQWQDTFTGLYTRWEQHELAQQLQHEFATQPGPKFAGNESLAAEARAIEQAAARFRRTATQGQAIGRIIIPRLGLNMVLVNGTDEGSLQRGPGRDLRTYMPGQDRL